MHGWQGFLHFEGEPAAGWIYMDEEPGFMHEVPVTLFGGGNGYGENSIFYRFIHRGKFSD